jgi:hypothetical protein
MYIVAIELGLHIMEVLPKTLGAPSSLQRQSFVQSLQDCSKYPTCMECENKMFYTKSQVLTLLNPRRQSERQLTQNHQIVLWAVLFMPLLIFLISPMKPHKGQ